jgi:trigger factor
LERYLQIMGQSEEEWRADVKRQAERQLKARLLLDQLAQQESLEVDRAQVDEEIERTAMGYGDQADQVRRSLRGEEGRRRVTTSLRRHEAIQKLVERAGGYPPDELGVLSEETAPSTAEVASEPAAAPASVD